MEGAATTTMASLLTTITSVFTSAIGWVGTVASTITDEPLLLIGCVLSLHSCFFCPLDTVRPGKASETPVAVKCIFWRSGFWKDYLCGVSRKKCAEGEPCNKAVPSLSLSFYELDSEW